MDPLDLGLSPQVLDLPRSRAGSYPPPIDTYRILRYYRDSMETQVVASGLSLADAREHCRNPETSSRTATSPEATARTEQYGPWFDGYDEE